MPCRLIVPNHYWVHCWLDINDTSYYESRINAFSASSSWYQKQHSLGKKYNSKLPPFHRSQWVKRICYKQICPVSRSTEWRRKLIDIYTFLKQMISRDLPTKCGQNCSCKTKSPCHHNYFRDDLVTDGLRYIVVITRGPRNTSLYVPNCLWKRYSKVQLH